jgi:hypothetical protein
VVVQRDDFGDRKSLTRQILGKLAVLEMLVGRARRTDHILNHYLRSEVIV